MALNFKALWTQLSGLSPQEKELISQFEKDPKATTLVASSDILRKRGYVDEAIILLEDTIKKFPNYMAARVALGRDYYSRGMFAEAQREITVALNQTVENLMAQRLQLKLALLADDRDKIHKSLEVLSTLTPVDDFTRSAKEYIELSDYVSARNMVVADLRRHGIAPPEDVNSTRHQSELNTLPNNAGVTVKQSLPDFGDRPRPEPSENSQTNSEWKIPSSSAADADVYARPATDSDGIISFGHGGVSMQPALIDNSGFFADLPPWINEQLLPPAFTPGSGLANVRGDLDRYLQLRAFRLITSPEAFSRKRALQQAYSLESTTLADIYASQGHFERAIAIYERLLKDNPTQHSLRQKLENLHEQARQSAAERYGVTPAPSKQNSSVQDAAQAERERKLKFLEALLKKMDERDDTPAARAANAQWPAESNSGINK